MNFLNYKHLRYFLSVVRAGTLTKAAEQLNISQSALSIQIRTLEDQLGQALFERQGRSLVLTEAGRIALDHAETIFNTGDHLLATLKGVEQTRPTVRIGALSTLSRNFLIGWLKPVLAQERAHVILHSGSVRTLLNDLERMNLDVVLMNVPAGREAVQGFRAHRLFEQKVSLVGTPELVRASKNLESLISTQPLILPTQDSSIRTGFDALTHRLGLQPVPVAEADDMAMLRLLVKTGIGVAPLPPVVVRDELANGELQEAFALKGVTETFYAITMERKFSNPLVKLLLENSLIA